MGAYSLRRPRLSHLNRLSSFFFHLQQISNEVSPTSFPLKSESSVHPAFMLRPGRVEAAQSRLTQGPPDYLITRRSHPLLEEEVVCGPDTNFPISPEVFPLPFLLLLSLPLFRCMPITNIHLSFLPLYIVGFSRATFCKITLDRAVVMAYKPSEPPHPWRISARDPNPDR